MIRRISYMGALGATADVTVTDVYMAQVMDLTIRLLRTNARSAVSCNSAFSRVTYSFRRLPS